MKFIHKLESEHRVDDPFCLRSLFPEPDLEESESYIIKTQKISFQGFTDTSP